MLMPFILKIKLEDYTMAVTIGAIKELREISGVGMSDCKKALTETGGNIEKAVEYLREAGLSAATKKSGRIAAEGLVTSIVKDGVATIVEVNSETDFVAKNEGFISFVNEVAVQACKSDKATAEELLTEKWYLDESMTVAEALSSKIAVIGENLTIRRFEKLEAKENSNLVSYIHGAGKVAVVIDVVCETKSDKIDEIGKNICMQIAAMNPKFLSEKDVSEEFKNSERKILREQALNEGKPEAIVDKMVVGRLNKILKETCLLEQEYVKDGDFTVKTYLEAMSKEIGSTVTLGGFARFETGEGIEKKEEDFAAEVAKTMNS